VVVREKPTPSPTVKKVETVISTPPKTVPPPKKAPTNQEKVNQYIERFGPIASQEMKKFGIPASITLAQGILESGMGYGRLAIEGNNHFGIKCHKDWNGKKIFHDDDKKGECFRVYKDPATSYRDHSLFLSERSRYAFLFDIKKTNYKAWARGLKKAGYATDPKYPEKLIQLIDRYDLTKFDEAKRKKVVSKSTQLNSNSKKTHTVVKGDTLYNVSKRYNVPLETLIKINKIKDQTIFIGQTIEIPFNH
jgi:flagellum-specific peptidoglycan hydrolase FlgJ